MSLGRMADRSTVHIHVVTDLWADTRERCVDSDKGCQWQSSRVTAPGGAGGWRQSLDLGLLLVPHFGDRGSALLGSSGDPTEGRDSGCHLRCHLWLGKVSESIGPPPRSHAPWGQDLAMSMGRMAHRLCAKWSRKRLRSTHREDSLWSCRIPRDRAQLGKQSADVL
jgi:hypothetical protein